MVIDKSVGDVQDEIDGSIFLLFLSLSFFLYVRMDVIGARWTSWLALASSGPAVAVPVGSQVYRGRYCSSPTA